MCGIAGLIGEKNGSAAEHAVHQMMGTLERRGPDGEGLDVWADAVLGHRRLAIFDLSEAGRQPMLSPDKSLGIVFNGAIYNFRELRLELASRGYQFLSQTDTEVLLHGYREWGIDKLVSKIRGMFAFGLWDNKHHKLFLVRDRLGVKPLFFVVRDGQLAFASSVRALRTAGFTGEIDEQAVTDYLEFGFVTEERTIYKGVSRVPVACILEWSEQRIDIRQYWQPSPPDDSTRISFAEAVEETERLFLKAVEKRLFADVPVGSLLSGGVDSSLVCWALVKLGADITAYTVGTPNDAADETADARATATALGIRHQTFNLSAEDVPDITELTSAYPEPFACSSALGMLRVARAVAGEATVLLTGDGGDDVFLGYPEHRHLWLAERFARALPRSAVDLWRGLGTHPANGQFRRLASFLNYSSGGLGAVTNAHDGLPSYKQRGVLGDRLTGFTVDQRKIGWSQDSARRVLSEYLEYDRNTRFVSEFLVKVDGATMHFGLEARSPFLDQELWEFAAALPYSVRLRHGKLKAVLRELARRRIGDRVAARGKRGFTVPAERWLTGKWHVTVSETLRHSILARDGWIQAAPTLEWLEESIQTGNAPKQLWYLFVLESWLRNEVATVRAAA